METDLVLVTFKTNAHGDITMFDTAAIPLLKLAGLSGKVPGALVAEDVGPVLQTLRSALAEQSETDTQQPARPDASGAGAIGTGGHTDADDDELESVALSTRAVPLLGLLEAARDASENVLWEG